MSWVAAFWSRAVRALRSPVSARIRTVKLRDERDGRDSRSLTANLTSDGSLRIAGHDLGPKTAIVSEENEYEWTYTFPVDSVPALCAALSGADHEDILDVLDRGYTGERSYQLERIIQETVDTIPREFWSWSP
jgi:hypothetical protein